MNSKITTNALCQKLLSKRVRHSTTTIQVMSDLHLELSEDYLSFNIPPRAPYLLLAGDIGRLSQQDKYIRFLRYQCTHFVHVYLVLGNHEFYGLSRESGLRLAHSIIEDPELRGKLTILNRKRVDLSSTVTILGCTLQSRIFDEARDIVIRKVADFRRIEGWTVDDHNREHYIDLNWLRAEIETIYSEEPQRSIVIVTHHAPSNAGTSDPKHEQNPWNSAFSTDILESQLASWKGIENIKFWVFGHTHWCADFQSGNIRVVSNQRGYVLPDPLMKSRSEIAQRAKSADKPNGFDVGKCIVVP